MEKRAYKQKINKSQNDLLWSMTTESATIYNAAIQAYKILSFKEADKEKPNFPKRLALHSQSYQASSQRAAMSVKCFFKAIKDWKKNPQKYKNKPEFPKSNKKTYIIDFKKSAIKIKGRNLYLSTGYRKNPIVVPWSLSPPIFASIKMERGEWMLFCVFNKEIKKENLNSLKIASIDLGVKRIATIFDGQNTILYSGKPILSLNRYKNKQYGKLSKLKGNQSRRAKRKKLAIKRSIEKVQNIKKDILHKYSRSIINQATKGKIGKIIFGDCSTIHNSTNCGKKENQKISENPEQKLRKYIEYKFASIGGTTEIVSETYTSQTCPVCESRHKPKDRNYSCKCGFKFDRDGVGAINIYLKDRNNVSFREVLKNKYERSRLLTRPIGVKACLDSSVI